MIGDIAALERWPGYDEQSWAERFAELDRRHSEFVGKLDLVVRQLGENTAQAAKDYATTLTDLQARLEAAEAEVAEWKQTAIAFGAPYMVQYAEAHGLPKNHLYDVHYDILARAGARMDDFTRATLGGEHG